MFPQTLLTGSSALKRRLPRFRNSLAWCGLVSLAAGWMTMAHAGDTTYNFDSPNGDPAKIPGFVLFGANAANAWHTNGGFSGGATDGFLEITPAANNENLGILFPLDLFTNADGSTVALPLKGFFLEADVRVGNAVGNNGRPADGFNISFASQDDPVVFWGKQGSFRGWAGGDSTAQALEPSSFNYATGVGSMDPSVCDSSTAENGTKTGVSVQFDTWQGNTIIDEKGLTAGGNDNVGWRVHFNGKMLERILSQPPSGPLAQSPDPTGADVNGLAVCPAPGAPTDYTQDTTCMSAVCADTNSIQTGPYYLDDDGSHNGSFTNLCWTHLSVELTTNSPHLLTVTYKGRALVDHLALTNFSPYVGRLIMGGRTGGANENRDIDNVHVVTYPAVQSVYGGISSSSLYLNDFSVLLQNIGPAKVNKINSLTLDGQDILNSPNTTITIGDPNTTITYNTPTRYASGTPHVIIVNWTDAAGNTLTQQSSFTTAQWTIVPASDAVPAASIDKTVPGFLIQPHQVGGGEPNRMYWADEQLMGLHGTNHIDFSTLLNTNGQVQFSDVIDFANTGAGGQFGVDNSWDQLGIPAPDLSNDNNSAIAVTAYLYFPAAGTYVMGGNSDDGLRVTFAKNSHDLLGTPVAGLLFNDGRGVGSLQNLGALIVTNPGYYGFRLLWENGGGGSAVEWYMTQTPAGVTNVLINDVNNNPQTAIQAYQFSSAAPPYVSFAEPPLNDDSVPANQTLKYQLTDASTTVNSGSVVLKVNGTTQSPTVSPGSGVTTITQTAPASLWSQGTNTVELSFKDSAGTNYDYVYAFVVPPYVTLDPSLSVPLGSQNTSQPGFVLHVTQMDFGQTGDTSFGSPNQIDSANAMLAGLYFPWYGSNAVNTAGSVSSNQWNYNGVIDFDITGHDGNFTNDLPMPGIPGNFVTGNTGNNENNISAMFQFWAPLKAGYYRMGVNSDDGFRLWEGWGPTRQVLHVTGTGVDTDVGAVVSSILYGNGGFAVPPPVTPITAPVFVVTSNNVPDGQVINLTNKIAVVPRGFFGRSSGGNIYWAATNGAVAAILLNRPSDGFPSVMTASPPAPPGIPAVNVNGDHGQFDFWLTNNNLTASIGASEPFVIGSADFGKGASDVDFAFAVPQDGVYPLTLVWEQGGGGANLELSQILPDGTRILVNDPTNPNSVLAFRSVNAVTRPTVSIGKSGSTVTITFTGTLTSSSTVNGTYAPVAGATSPYTVPTGAAAAQFYRTK